MQRTLMMWLCVCITTIMSCKESQDSTVGNRYVNEEVTSYSTYPEVYGVKSVTEQVANLRDLFPELKDATFDGKLASSPLPRYAEGWFAIPRWQVLASTYGLAVQKVLATIQSKRSFYNYREGRLGEEFLRPHEHTTSMLKILANQQAGHNILIIPVQFGLLHRGQSVRRAREVFQPNEFGLGSFQVGTMFLTHPERLVQWNQLHLDCAGDEYARVADARFVYAPVFDFHDGGLKFGTRPRADAHWDYGSVSGFFPR